jgi:hypothetical protein
VLDGAFFFFFFFFFFASSRPLTDCANVGAVADVALLDARPFSAPYLPNHITSSSK